MMETVNEPEWKAPWFKVYRPWFLEGEQVVDCASGYEALLAAPLADSTRQRLADAGLDDE